MELVKLKSVVWCFVFTLYPATCFVPIDEFFPFGADHGDSIVPQGDDNSVGPIELRYPFQFFNVSHKTLFLNNNGAISFVQSVSQYTATCGALPQNLKMIAPFWADVHTGQNRGGSVFYRESTDRELLQKAARDINRAYPDLWGLSIGWLFITTWHSVAFYGASNCKHVTPTNTFQAVLASDGVRSFALFYYSDITWTTGTASGGSDACTGLGGQPAKAGFDVGDGKTFFEVPGSCRADIVNVDNTSNVDMPGKWIFRIDNTFESTTCDSEKYRNERLHINPSFVTVFGHVPITLTGPCFNSSMSVTCRFHDPLQELPHVTGLIQKNEEGNFAAVCTVPYLYTYGRIKVEMILKQEEEYTVYTGFIYATEPEEDVQIDISTTDSGKWAISLTWDPSYFGQTNSTLSLLLLEYETTSRTWVELGVVAKDISNVGTTELLTMPISVKSFVSFSLRMGQGKLKRDVSEVVDSAVDSVKGGSSRLLCAGSLFTFDNDKACQSWYEEDDGPPKDILPCPPLLAQASQDPRYERDGATGSVLEYFHPGADASFRQRNPSESGAGQQCTYRDGKLMVGPPGGGTADAVSPTKSTYEHWHRDVAPWCECCAYSENEASCRKYYEKRPSDPGDDYVPPPPARGNGDPHITTFDLTTYTFNGVGEFWMIKTNDFLMQARMEQYVDPTGSPTRASVFTAFALKDSEVIQVQLSQASGIDVLLDGELIAFDNNPSRRKLFTSTASISPSADQSEVTISLVSGFVFSFSTAENSLSVMATGSNKYKGKTHGLLGVFDGNPENDLQAPDGTVVSSSASLQDIHYNFGIKWMITSRESLFVYPEGKNYTNYANPNFEPNFNLPDITSLPQNVLDMCHNSMDCLYDYSTTGNVNFANLTRQLVQQFNETIETAEVLSRQVQMCPPVPRIDNGYVIIKNLFVGSTVAFGCEEGHQLVGHPAAKCGNSSEWDRTFPTCHSIGSASSCYQFLSATVLIIVVSFTHFVNRKWY